MCWVVVAGDGDDAESAQYTLYAVIVHQELSIGLVTGHYLCFVKLSDDRWFKCDDGDVSEVSEHTTLKQEAYMLFYQRRKPRAAPTTAPRAPPNVPAEPLKPSKPLSKPEAGTRTPQHTVTQLGSQTDVYGAQEGVQWPTQLQLSVHLPGVTSVNKVGTSPPPSLGLLCSAMLCYALIWSKKHILMLSVWKLTVTRRVTALVRRR